MNARAIRPLFVALLGLSVATAAMPAAAQGQRPGHTFLEAVREDDGTLVTAMVADDPRIVNTSDLVTRETALHIVTERQAGNWMRYLLRRGANPNKADRNGVTPLAIAAKKGFLEGVEELLKNGADVDIRNDAGETPLIDAVHRRDVPMIRALLEGGADPDRADNSGRTARDYAAYEGERSTVMAEIERSAKSKTGAKDKAASYGPTL